MLRSVLGVASGSPLVYVRIRCQSNVVRKTKKDQFSPYSNQFILLKRQDLPDASLDGKIVQLLDHYDRLAADYAALLVDANEVDLRRHIVPDVKRLRARSAELNDILLSGAYFARDDDIDNDFVTPDFVDRLTAKLRERATSFFGNGSPDSITAKHDGADDAAMLIALENEAHRHLRMAGDHVIACDLPYLVKATVLAPFFDDQHSLMKYCNDNFVAANAVDADGPADHRLVLVGGPSPPSLVAQVARSTLRTKALPITLFTCGSDYFDDGRGVSVGRNMGTSRLAGLHLRATPQQHLVSTELCRQLMHGASELVNLVCVLLQQRVPGNVVPRLHLEVGGPVVSSSTLGDDSTIRDERKVYQRHLVKLLVQSGSDSEPAFELARLEGWADHVSRRLLVQQSRSDASTSRFVSMQYFTVDFEAIAAFVRRCRREANADATGAQLN